MALIRGTSDDGAERWGAQLYRQGQQYSREGLNYASLALNELARDDARFRNSLANMRQRQAQKKAEKDDGMSFTSIGAIAGMALAPFTGGLSLATLAVGGAVGGGIGAVVDDATGRGDGSGAQQLMRAANYANDQYDENPFFTGKEQNDTVQQAVDKAVAGPAQGGTTPEKYKHQQGVNKAGAQPAQWYAQGKDTSQR